ncbi:MAG TPA: hypothetical protein VGO07_00170 [Candidatus Saccharimonadales bacterium]|nr:hypothetical protein [Candidatus Saccharimonadales bacterium]
MPEWSASSSLREASLVDAAFMPAEGVPFYADGMDITAGEEATPGAVVDAWHDLEITAGEEEADEAPAEESGEELPAANQSLPQHSVVEAARPPAGTDRGGSTPPKPPRHDTAGMASPDPDDEGAGKDSSPDQSESLPILSETESGETAANSTPGFREKIDAITSRRLSPENIETYADDALDDLVGVVDEITERYEQQSGVVDPASGADHERAALLQLGLDGDEIEATLDRIDDLSKEIAALDDVITAITTQTDAVITPPGETGFQLTVNAEPYDKEHIPRLKTLLFVLSNQFDIDLRDPEACSISNGIITDSMLRKESYRLVAVPRTRPQRTGV